jgi:hypothetical protein
MAETEVGESGFAGAMRFTPSAKRPQGRPRRQRAPCAQRVGAPAPRAGDTRPIKVLGEKGAEDGRHHAVGLARCQPPQRARLDGPAHAPPQLGSAARRHGRGSARSAVGLNATRAPRLCDLEGDDGLRRGGPRVLPVRRGSAGSAWRPRLRLAGLLGCREGSARRKQHWARDRLDTRLTGLESPDAYECKTHEPQPHLCTGRGSARRATRPLSSTWCARCRTRPPPKAGCEAGSGRGATGIWCRAVCGCAWRSPPFPRLPASWAQEHSTRSRHQP